MTIALHAPEAHLPVRGHAPIAGTVRPAAPATAGSRRLHLAVLLGIFVLCTALLAAAFVQSLLVSGQREIDRLNSERVEQEDLLHAERLELARAQAPDAVARRAEQLGMTRAEHRIVIDPDTRAVVDSGAPTP